MYSVLYRCNFCCLIKGSVVVKTKDSRDSKMGRQNVTYKFDVKMRNLVKSPSTLMMTCHTKFCGSDSEEKGIVSN